MNPLRILIAVKRADPTFRLALHAGFHAADEYADGCQCHIQYRQSDIGGCRPRVWLWRRCSIPEITTLTFRLLQQACGRGIGFHIAQDVWTGADLAAQSQRLCIDRHADRGHPGRHLLVYTVRVDLPVFHRAAGSGSRRRSAALANTIAAANGITDVGVIAQFQPACGDSAESCERYWFVVALTNSTGSLRVESGLDLALRLGRAVGDLK